MPSGSPDSPNGESAPNAAPSDSGVNIEKLADRVYRLMLNDVRLGLARGEQPPRMGGGRKSL